MNAFGNGAAVVEVPVRGARGHDRVRVELQLLERLVEQGAGVGDRAARPGEQQRGHGLAAVRRQDDRPRQVLRRAGLVRDRVELGLVVAGAAVRVVDLDVLRVLEMVPDARGVLARAADTVPAVAVATLAVPASPSEPAARASAPAMRSIAPLMRSPFPPSRAARTRWPEGRSPTPAVASDANGYDGFRASRLFERPGSGDTGRGEHRRRGARPADHGSATAPAAPASSRPATWPP